jgi:shikimate kinase
MKLSEQGFRRFCCDDMIACKLVSELRRPDGTVMGLGDWMGFPYEPQYQARESTYLACETEVLREILAYIEGRGHHSDENIAVDTTGSAIYAGEDILARLGHCSTVVHLSTPPEVQRSMFEAYLANRRPVLWRNLFTQRPGEDHTAALARCYPELLATRERLYERYAHVMIDYHTLNRQDFGIGNFLDTVFGKGWADSVDGVEDQGKKGPGKGKK